MTDQLLLDTAGRLFGDVCDFAAVEAAEADGFAADAWSAVAEVGLPWIGVDEAAGGAGGDVVDALAVLRVAGAHAVPLPLAETGVLAGWLLASAGLTVPDGAVTVAPGDPADDVSLADGLVSGTVNRVPWGSAVNDLVILVEDGDSATVVLVDTASATLEPYVNLAGEPRDTLVFDRVEPLASGSAGDGVDADALLYRGALTRVMLMAGALDAVSRLTASYTHEREQFGRPVARFQAVQSHLVTCAQEAAIAGVTADAVMRRLAHDDARFEIAAAKVVVSEAATKATAAAHQAHGAMGLTKEYELHHLSRRLWAWRNEYGGARYWSQVLGEAVVDVGGDGLYPLITGGSAALG